MKLRAIIAAVLILLTTQFAVAGERGVASWYGPREHGRVMANGQRFNQWAPTVAHRTLPFGTVLRVRNPANGKTVKVTVTDRGPYIKGRIIDLSRGIARSLSMEEDGLAVVEIEVVKKPKNKRRT